MHGNSRGQLEGTAPELTWLYCDKPWKILFSIHSLLIEVRNSN